MFDRFSERAGKILTQGARDVAREFGTPIVETEHVLLAILRNEECVASKILRKLTKPEKIEEEAAKLKPQNPETGIELDRMSFSDEAKDLIARSDDESARQGMEMIGSEHVLLAMATQIPNGRAFKVLRQSSVNFGQISAVLDELCPKKTPDNKGTESGRGTIQVNRTMGMVFFNPALSEKEIEIKLYTIMQIKGVELAKVYREGPQAADLPPLTSELGEA